MPYFPVDDQAAFHPKFVMAGNAAIGLWTRAGSWSKNHATGGFIPVAIAGSMGTRGEIKKLVEVGLWEQVLGGYLFHDWDHYGANRVGAEEEARRDARREADRERQRRHRDKQRDGHTVTERDEEGVTGGVTSRARGPHPSPVPAMVDSGLNPSVLETSRENEPDDDFSESEYVRKAADLRVDFLRVRDRYSEQAEERVPNEVVLRCIRIVTDRGVDRGADRTGLVISSLRKNWSEWSRLVFQEAS